MIRTWLVLLLVGCGFATVQAAPLPPSPTPNYIRDDAGWFGPAAFLALDGKLQTFERETSSQFVVAIFPKLPEGEELFDFSQRLYEFWKPGSAAQDNGAILLIFAEDRQLRIHTGAGMEGVLPDARCKQIIADVIAPLLRQGNREAAVSAGVDAMIAAAKGEYTGNGRTRLDGQEQNQESNVFLFLILGFLLFTFILPRFLGGRDTIFSQRGRTRTGGGWIGGFPGGGFGGGGGGFGGGGGGGGGFSGGGGSSGGGGASGSW